MFLPLATVLAYAGVLAAFARYAFLSAESFEEAVLVIGQSLCVLVFLLVCLNMWFEVAHRVHGAIRQKLRRFLKAGKEPRSF